MTYTTRSPKEIQNDIRTAKEGKYFENSQKLVATVACLAITGILADWAKSTSSAIGGETCGGLAGCIVIALGKMCSGYVHYGISYCFFQPLVNNIVLPRLEAEKKQAEEERSLYSRLSRIFF
ncbi:MAG: hypothetical protein K2Q33_01075 [Gammaproteobacteria bacterium]|nr:hypothetical protein [Gammaproteobacteria bacterium]